MSTREVEVRRVHDEAIGIRSFELADPGGAPLPAFAAGAHVDVHIAPGVTRQYSLCNSPAERHRYLIAVKREPASRGGSRMMHELAEGRRLTIGEPRNNFPLDPAATHHILLAGGIGITPILAMAHELASGAASFELHYFFRSGAHAAFASLLSSLPHRGAVEFHEGAEPPELEPLMRRILLPRRADAHAYVCGPGPFMHLAGRVAEEGWPPGAMHREYFAAAPDPAAAQGEFEVRLARTGASFRVPRGMTIAQVLAANGVAVSTSCEQGLCGSCVTDVLEGVPDHQDIVLSDEEKAAGKTMCLCVSRSKTAFLVLDL